MRSRGRDRAGGVTTRASAVSVGEFAEVRERRAISATRSRRRDLGDDLGDDLGACLCGGGGQVEVPHELEVDGEAPRTEVIQLLDRREDLK